MLKLLCPRCEQNYLSKALIIPLDQHIIICPDCEAFWPVGVDITMQNFLNYSVYMESNGYPWDWKLLQVVKD